MAFRYSSSIAPEVLYHIFIWSTVPIWVLGFYLYYVGSSHIATRTMGRYPFSHPSLLTHLEVVCRAEVQINCKFTGIILIKH
jgi:hypothetical protein